MITAKRARRLGTLFVLAMLTHGCASYYQTVYRATGRCSTDRKLRHTMRLVFGDEPSPGAYCPIAFPLEE
jgi:hypothetical protein